MPKIIIDEEAYKKTLLNANNYANITTAENDDAIIDNFIKITEPAAGWYVTDFFFKDKNTTTQTIYENKEFNENIKSSQKKSTSKTFNFNDKITTELLENKNNNIFKTAIFNIAFPISINTHQIIIVMSIKKLPFEIDFEFLKDGEEIKTTPRVQQKYLENETYEQVLSSLKNDKINVKENFEILIYEITDVNMKYTDFLRFLYSDQPQRPNITKLIDLDKLHDLFFPQQDFLTCLINTEKQIEIINNSDAVDFQFNILPIKNENNNKIQFFANLEQNETDARKLYWKNCILNDTNIPNDKKYKDSFEQKMKNKNARANYYDINFKTSDVKTFLFTYHSPGFHVINFRPDNLYLSPSNVTIKKNGGTKIISLQDVYKKLFINKILQLNIEQLQI